MEFTLNMYHVLALAPVVFYLGEAIINRVEFFKKYCIPAPVVGGLVFAILKLILHETGLLLITTDNMLQTPFMYAFFCSVGFSARFKLLKKGGILLAIMTAVVATLCLFQDVLGVTIAKLMGVHPLLGVCLGSIPLVGGHGTAAAFGGLIEDLGAPNAAMAAIAAATFGLVAGSLIGGPLARRRIVKRNLQTPYGLGADVEKNALAGKQPVPVVEIEEETEKKTVNKKLFILAAFLLCIAVGLGDVIAQLIGSTGLIFSAAVGSLLAGLIIRNICDFKNIELPDKELSICGDLSLYMYLSMAMLSLNLWELASLALPMIVILAAQTIFMGLFAYFIVFNITGRDYEASVLTAGVCGFGLGAVVNGLASMEAIKNVYGPATKAFLVVPILGSFLADTVNTAIIMVFINLFG